MEGRHVLQSMVVSAVRWAPAALKNWVHRHRQLDAVARRGFAVFLGGGGREVTIRLGPMKGLRLAVSEHISHAHVSGTYELPTQRAVQRLVSSNSICYDAGASIGYMSLLMAQRARHVYAFEPAPHAVAEMRRQLTVNRIENVTIVERPLSDGERSVDFALTDNAFGSRIASPSTRWPTVTLRTLTLDDFIQNHPFPDFIKIDVEDEEGRVLRGARELLRKRKTVICCELHSEQAARDVLEILGAYGFQVTTLDGQPVTLPDRIVPGEVQIIASPRLTEPVPRYVP
jgi:FkbM family methyltransferase